jgi:NAD-dependent DNA ligase
MKKTQKEINHDLAIDVSAFALDIVLRKAKEEYYEGIPSLSDKDYDILKMALKVLKEKRDE